MCRGGCFGETVRVIRLDLDNVVLWDVGLKWKM